MIKLITKLTILCVPILMLIGVCLAVGLDVGEIYPLSTIAQLQLDNRAVKYNLIGVSNKHLQYKYESILVQEPQLVLMGSSRTWYFREHVANRCTRSFINASYGNSSVFEMANILQKVIDNDKSPEVILLSIDYPDYNADSDYRDTALQLDEVSPLDYFIDSSKRTIVQVLLNPRSVRDLLGNSESTTQLGWGFVIENTPNYYNGDGSYVEAKFDEGYLPIGLDVHNAMIEQESLQYQSGSTVDDNALQALETILQLSADNNIKIIGFFPPFHKEIREQLANDGRFTYIPTAHTKITDLFDAYRFPIYDFSDPVLVGGSEEGMYDGWHSGERLSTQIYLQLLQNEPDTLSKYSDVNVLNGIVNSADNAYTLEIDPSEVENARVCE